MDGISVVHGEDVVILINQKKSLHATKHTLTCDLTTEELNTIHAQHFNYPVKTDWSASLEGVCVIDEANAATSNSAEILLDLFLAKTALPIVFTAGDAGLLSGATYTGTGYIEKYELSGEAAGKATYSISIKSASNILTKVPKA